MEGEALWFITYKNLDSPWLNVKTGKCQETQELYTHDYQCLLLANSSDILPLETMPLAKLSKTPLWAQGGKSHTAVCKQPRDKDLSGEHQREAKVLLGNRLRKGCKAWVSFQQAPPTAALNPDAKPHRAVTLSYHSDWASLRVLVGVSALAWANREESLLLQWKIQPGRWDKLEIAPLAWQTCSFLLQKTTLCTQQNPVLNTELPHWLSH